MLNLLILFFLLAGGYTFRKSHWGGRRSEKISTALNLWVIRVALPALVLQKIHSLPEFSIRNPEVYLPATQPWIQFLLALLVLTPLARFLGWKRAVWGALVMTVGLGNTSFVGLPLLRVILGSESLATGILQDQLGSFLVLSVVGIPFAQMISSSRASEKSPKWHELLIRPLRFPAFMALMTALALARVPFPSSLEAILGFLGGTLSPAALLSVGMRLRFSALLRKEIRTPFSVGILLKLGVFPALYFWVYPLGAQALGGISQIVISTVLLESAMASQITGGLIAAEQKLEPDLARLMVGVSIPLSLVTVKLWSFLLP